MKSRPNPEFDEFTHTVDRLLSVPRDELQRREKEYREQVANNPRKRGPKQKIKPSASRDTGDGTSAGVVIPSLPVKCL